MTPRPRALAPVVALGAVALVALAAAPASAAEPPDIHHVLILDDSGSMERQFDLHGFGLAAPQLFQRLLGARAADRLTVLLLPQIFPQGPVPRLAPTDFLTYPRENGTAYARSIEEALAEAARSTAAQVAIVLVTDAEPDDARARALIDRALAAPDARVTFRCVQLGSHDEGDLCDGRATHAADGFDMVRALTSHLAAAMNSVPRWGRLGGQGAAAPIPLGRFVKRVHVLLVGLAAGVDFRAELTADGAAPRTSPIDHTRPLLDPRQRPGPFGQPSGRGPRLALQTFTVDVDPDRPDPDAPYALTLSEANGEVAYGVILEYDLAAELEVPAEVPLDAGAFRARAHLTHRGRHFDDVEFFAAVALTPTLVVTSDCPAESRCTPTRTLPMTLGADGWATVEVPLEDLGELRSVARFTGATADFRSDPRPTTVTGALAADLTPLPAPDPIPAPDPTPEPDPDPVPDPAPDPPPAAADTRWIPPVLKMPDWEFEDRDMGYALTVVSHDGRQLTADELTAHGLTADLLIDGAPSPMTRVGDRFEVRWNTGAPRLARFVVVIRWPGGDVRSNEATLEVIPDARVVLAPDHDFGRVASGCATLAHCEPLDFTGSRRLDGLPLAIRRVPGAWADLTLTVRHGDRAARLTRDAPVELVYDGQPVTLCYAPPRCDEPPERASEQLVVAPTDPRLSADPARAGTTRVVADVAPNTWLDCNLWWLLIVGGGVLFLIIVYGYVRPHGFSEAATLHVADKERRLARDPGRPLRSVPLGRRGFYRSATCSLDASGFTVRRGHVLQLRAESGGQIALAPRGATVERLARGRWLPLDDDRALMSGTVYRVNQSFFFKVLC